jgi:hypothetical protein
VSVDVARERPLDAAAPQEPSAPARGPERLTALLASRAAPWFFAALTAILLASVWGSMRQIPTVHDEFAYVFQAKLFASGRWRAPSPPLPEFFEQYHLLVTPVMASKYPPGHSLLLAPGIWVGLPGLMPLAALAATGGLLFALARRFSNPWVALLAWTLWIQSPAVLRFAPSYLSETTTGALWLIGWWALLRWRDRGRPAWLAALALCVGWGFLTRPLTTLAFFLPAAVVVLRTGIARRRFRDVALGAALGAGVLLLLPLWSARTMGDWRTPPLAAYTRMYLPFDVMGFGRNAAAPERPLPENLSRASAYFGRIHEEHTVDALPRTLADRLVVIAQDAWAGASVTLLAFACIGLFVLRPEPRLACLTAGLLFLLYLAYGHPAAWTVYYLEAYPVIAFVTAAGVWTLIAGVTSRLSTRSDLWTSSPGPRAPLAAASVALVLFVVLGYRIGEARAGRRAAVAPYETFARALSGISGERALVFVRYASPADMHRSLVNNDPDWPTARVWIAQDRGADNARLLKRAPDRAAYVYDEKRRALRPL